MPGKQPEIPSIDNSGDERPSNSSTNPHFAEVAGIRQQRRIFLKGGLGLALTAFMGGGLSACGRAFSNNDSTREADAAAASKRLNFTAVSASTADQVRVPAGYSAKIFVPWGTPLQASGPAFADDASNSGEDQAQQVGSHHDGMHFFPMPPNASSRQQGLLVMNHEYVDPNVLHPNGPTLGETRPTEEVAKEMAGHGVSILHVLQDRQGEWQLVADSPYSRRITATTPISIEGPARGADMLKTRYSSDGTATRGTLNNCSSGMTPWNTYLTAEENWAGYFVNRDAAVPREHSRYGVEPEHSRYRWETADTDDDLYQRFDATRTGATAADDFRNEPNCFGWMVEIDPFDPQSQPRKRTGLGRFAHEGVVFAPAAEGEPLVCYSGDDSRHEYIYKFVSAKPYRAATASGELLDEGTLYVARFNDDGTGHWLPLDVNNPQFRDKARAAGVTFADQADLLINTRLAADIAGATKMDRPEWGAIHPVSGEVYFTLTNNTERELSGTDAANPRANNTDGHIIRWRESGSEAAGRYAGIDFNWDLFLLGGDVGTEQPGDGGMELGEDNHFASPDGLWFDPNGLLWIQTDMSGKQLSSGPFGNNQMLVADPETRAIKRFLTGPVDAEITGITLSPDGKSLFVNIQHPGAKSEPKKFTSHWPAGGSARPRSATVIVTKDDGDLIGT